MIKRITIVGLAVALLVALFLGRDAVSYVATSYLSVKNAIKSQVPVSFDIDRARNELRKLEPDIRRNMEAIAKEEVQLEQLDKRISDLEAKQSRDKADMTTLQSDLRSGNKTFRYSGVSYTESEVKTDLARKLARCRTNDSTLENLKKVSNARTQKLEASRQKLEEMLAMRKLLEVQLEEIDAKREMIEVAKTAEVLSFDDSQLGRIKELISDLETRLAVEDRLLNASDVVIDEIRPSEPEVSEDIVDEVASYLRGEPVEHASLASADVSR
jgi:chromosome segregation ATPase